MLDTASWRKCAAGNDLVEQFLAPAQMARFLDERSCDLAQARAEMGRTR